MTETRAKYRRENGIIIDISIKSGSRNSVTLVH